MTQIEDAELTFKAVKIMTLLKTSNVSTTQLISDMYPDLTLEQKLSLMVECEKIYIKERFYL